MHKKRSHSAMKECKTKQLTDCNKKSFQSQKQNALFLLTFVNEMWEKIQMWFAIFKQAMKQEDRAGKLDQSLQKQICKFQGEKPQKSL